MILSGSAPQSTGTNGPAARGLAAWIARATSSLPVPLSPRISTWLSLWRRPWMVRRQAPHAGRAADQLGQPGALAQLGLELAVARTRRRRSTAWRTVVRTRCTSSKGFAR